MQRLALPIAFHLLPLAALALGHLYGAAAAVLLVALPYIKVKKLGYDVAFKEQLRADQGREGDLKLAKAIRSASEARERWRLFTFLRPDAGESR